jgi:hypothetical protein
MVCHHYFSWAVFIRKRHFYCSLIFFGCSIYEVPVSPKKKCFQYEAPCRRSNTCVQFGSKLLSRVCILISLDCHHQKKLFFIYIQFIYKEHYIGEHMKDKLRPLCGRQVVGLRKHVQDYVLSGHVCSTVKQH